MRNYDDFTGSDKLSAGRLQDPSDFRIGYNLYTVRDRDDNYGGAFCASKWTALARLGILIALFAFAGYYFYEKGFKNNRLTQEIDKATKTPH